LLNAQPQTLATRQVAPLWWPAPVAGR